MTEERVKRKLSAILSADVVEYSRLMGEDEVLTVKTLEAYRKVMADLIEQFRGRVVDSPGDNLLAEFSSVVDAVQFAVEIHEVIRAKNEDLPEDRRMLFRIGVNLGDVIQEGDRIYGDGVNIAARLEGLAEPGGVCISGSAHEQIENKLALGYEYLGEHTVKNIAKPVKVYKVPMGTKAVVPEKKKEKKSKLKNRQWTALSALGAIIVIIGALVVWNSYLRGPSIEPASIEPEQTSPVPDIKEAPKSIAILPFEDISPDKDQEYFADGIAEELINKLTQVKGLEVTARTSSFYFKGKNMDMRTIGEKLDVSYLLEGSVRKSENQLRITAQLIKTEDGYHLFSKTYERELKDIFAIQDEIAKEVTTALSVTLGVGEFNRPGMTRKIEAYDELLRARTELYKYTRDSILSAIDHIKHALDIDPDFGYGWLALYNSYISITGLLPPEQTADFVEKASEALERARVISPDLPNLPAITAKEKARNGDWLEAERFWKETIDKYGHAYAGPNTAYGQMLLRLGRSNDALQYFQRAKRLNPMEPGISLYLSWNLLILKRMDEAIAEARRGQALEGLNWLLKAVEEGITLNANERISSVANTFANFPNTKRFGELLIEEDREAALSELKKLTMDTNIPYLLRIPLAELASVFGDPELAFKNIGSLDKSLALITIWDPMHKDLRKLPAFKIYIRESRLYDYWRTSGNWSDFCHPIGEDDFECD